MLRSILSALLLAALPGCGEPGGHGDAGPRPGPPRVNATHTGDRPIKVLCTTGMVADLVANVGGRHVMVDALMGPGVDPHLYKPLPEDSARLRWADMIFYSGLHLEGKMSDTLRRLEASRPVFPVAEYLPAGRLLRAEAGAYDPHVWFDVALWSEAASVVEQVLSAYDPPHAADYAANAARYREELAALDAEVRAAVTSIPQRQRVLVTAHDAFRYFGRAYGIEVRGVQGVSTASDASIADVRALVDLLVERGIKAVFVESSIPPERMDALIEGCARKGHRVAKGGELYSDAMGEADTPAGTYVGMVRHNTDAIVGALK